MPLGTLICEGKRDTIIFRAIADKEWVVQPTHGGLPALQQVVLLARTRRREPVFALRDRDFEPAPADGGVAEWCPKVDGEPVHIGFYLRGFELENYLLLPDLVDAACGDLDWWDLAEYTAYLTATCRAWRGYLAARRTLHDAREALPKPFRFSDRPWQDEPWADAPEADRCRQAVARQIASFHEEARLAGDRFDAAGAFDRHLAKLDSTWLDSGDCILDFPGKDLEQLVDRWYVGRLGGGASETRPLGRVMRWVSANAEAAVERVADWRELLDRLRR